MIQTIEHVIRRIPEWAGKSITVEPLAGGITNLNYLVTVDGARQVLRIPGASTDLLAIDRTAEFHNSQAASAAGVAPKILHFLAEDAVMVREFVAGEVLTIEALRRPGMPTRLAQSIRELHAGPRFANDFDMIHLTRYYLAIVEERSITIPEGFWERVADIDRIETALAVCPLATVPCHNDLLAGNLIDDGQRLWIIDFEYGGNNDPCFELGNTAQEQEYDDAMQTELCAGYFGSADAKMLARMKLHMVMSDLGWSLWASIQARISTLDFDFLTYGNDRYYRAAAKLDGGGFETWLETAAGQHM